MSYLRRLPKFEYLAPRTPEEVCDLLAAHSDEAKLLAGGTDLILQMRRRAATPRCIIGLKGVPGLAFIREQADGGLAIGAMTTMQTLASAPVIRAKYGLLSRTAAEMGSTEIRQVATIGGNLAGALPCADFPPALITLGAKVKLQSKRGDKCSERLVPIEDFFLRYEQTAAGRDELLTEIQLPSLPSFSDGVYLKFHDRHSMDMTTVGVAVFVTGDRESGVFRDVKIALASSAPMPMRAKKAEAALRGRAFTEDALEEACSLVCGEADPRTSWRATKAFRLELLHNLTKRAITDAWKRVVSSSNGGGS